MGNGTGWQVVIGIAVTQMSEYAVTEGLWCSKCWMREFGVLHSLDAGWLILDADGQLGDVVGQMIEGTVPN